MNCEDLAILHESAPSKFASSRCFLNIYCSWKYRSNAASSIVGVYLTVISANSDVSCSTTLKHVLPFSMIRKKKFCYKKVTKNLTSPRKLTSLVAVEMALPALSSAFAHRKREEISAFPGSFNNHFRALNDRPNCGGHRIYYQTIKTVRRNDSFAVVVSSCTHLALQVLFLTTQIQVTCLQVLSKLHLVKQPSPLEICLGQSTTTERVQHTNLGRGNYRASWTMDDASTEQCYVSHRFWEVTLEGFFCKLLCSKPLTVCTSSLMQTRCQMAILFEHRSWLIPLNLLSDRIEMISEWWMISANITLICHGITLNETWNNQAEFHRSKDEVSDYCLMNAVIIIAFYINFNDDFQVRAP